MKKEPPFWGKNQALTPMVKLCVCSAQIQQKHHPQPWGKKHPLEMKVWRIYWLLNFFLIEKLFFLKIIYPSEDFFSKSKYFQNFHFQRMYSPPEGGCYFC